MKKLISLILISVLCLCFISCGSDNLKTPPADVPIVGEHYEKVEKAFKDAGFKNIVTEKTEDLIFGFFSDENEVKTVLINGEDIYEPDKSIPKDSEIKIIYHAYPDLTWESETAE